MSSPSPVKKLTQQQLVNMWKKFADTYPIISWRTVWLRQTGKAKQAHQGHRRRVQLVGDDPACHMGRLSTGIEKKRGHRQSSRSTRSAPRPRPWMPSRWPTGPADRHRVPPPPETIRRTPTIADIAVALNAGHPPPTPSA